MLLLENGYTWYIRAPNRAIDEDTSKKKNTGTDERASVDKVDNLNSEIKWLEIISPKQMSIVIYVHL